MSKIKLTLGTGGIGTGKNFTAGSDMAMLRQTFIEASEIRQV